MLIKGHILYVATTKYSESASYLKMMLEYLHLQMTSLVTNKMNEELQQRPNLDVRSNISNLERPLLMMSEMVRRSPSCFLNAYPVITLNPLFRTDMAQLIADRKPKDFYYGLVVSATQVLALISSPEDPNPEIKASDVNLIFNYIHSTPSLMEEETWTTMCIPGISEEFLLHVYCKFYNEYLGLVFISTSDEFEAFDQFSTCATELFNDIETTGMNVHLFQWASKWYEPVNM